MIIFKEWQDGFDAFCSAFEDYLSAFPEFGWHEPHMQAYAALRPVIRSGNRVNRPGTPFFKLNCAVMLLLDGRKPLSKEQREMRHRLVFRWRQIERSANAAPIGDGHRIQYPR